ncbi:MAG: hypothetical protein ACFCUR_20910 [Rhodomicrobiaceae bacterium]
MAGLKDWDVETAHKAHQILVNASAELVPLVGMMRGTSAEGMIRHLQDAQITALDVIFALKEKEADNGDE